MSVTPGFVPSGGGPASITVLHVDDDPDMTEVTAEFLERQTERLDVLTETCADEGLDRCDDPELDCIVSDYDMPEMDGIEFLETVREQHPEMPFILFTGKGSEEVASEAISAGVDDYIQKDVSPEQYELLCNRIENAVAKRRAQMNYRELFEKTNVGLTLHDPETGVITDTNRAFGEILGYDRAELIGKHPGELASAESGFTRERADRLLEETLEEGSRTFEWCDRTKNDEEVWVEVHLERTTIDDRGQVLAVVRDITDRKQREQALATAKRKFESVFEYSNDAIFVIDVEADSIMDCNPAAAELVGYSREELLSMSPADLHPHDFPEFSSFAESVLEEGHGWTDTLSCRSKDGGTVPAEVSAAVCEIDGRTCIVSNIRPVYRDGQ